MTTIKTWKERIVEDKWKCTDRTYMQAEITELREALKLAEKHVELHRRVVHRLQDERNALQAKLSELEKQEPVARVDDLERGGKVRAMALGLGLDQSLYAHPVAPAQPPKDHEIAQLVNDLKQIAISYYNHQSLRDRISARVLETVKAAQPLKLDDIEQYRMQMAGISTAAIGYWKEGDNIHPDYDTVALRDVAKLYAKYDELYKAAQPLTKEHEWFAKEAMKGVRG